MANEVDGSHPYFSLWVMEAVEEIFEIFGVKLLKYFLLVGSVVHEEVG